MKTVRAAIIVDCRTSAISNALALLVTKQLVRIFKSLINACIASRWKIIILYIDARCGKIEHLCGSSTTVNLSLVHEQWKLEAI